MSEGTGISLLIQRCELQLPLTWDMYPRHKLDVSQTTSLLRSGRGEAGRGERGRQRRNPAERVSKMHRIESEAEPWASIKIYVKEHLLSAGKMHSLCVSLPRRLLLSTSNHGDDIVAGYLCLRSF